MLRFSLDAIASFSHLPLQVATYLGFLFAGVAFILIPVVVALHFTGGYLPGFGSLTILILLIGGLQLIALGLIGEYVGRIYDEVKRRPLYIVREQRNEHVSLLELVHEDALPELTELDGAVRTPFRQVGARRATPVCHPFEAVLAAARRRHDQRRGHPRPQTVDHQREISSPQLGVALLCRRRCVGRRHHQHREVDAANVVADLPRDARRLDERVEGGLEGPLLGVERLARHDRRHRRVEERAIRGDHLGAPRHQLADRREAGRPGRGDLDRDLRARAPCDRSGPR